MPDLPLARPETVGLDAARLQRVYDRLQCWVKEDKVPAAALCIGRKGRLVEPCFFGRQKPEADAPPLRKSAAAGRGA